MIVKLKKNIGIITVNYIPANEKKEWNIEYTAKTGTFYGITESFE